MKWKKENEQFLIENYKNTSYKDIAEKFNTTEGAIRAKCFELNLIKKDKWTEDDLNYVKENYQNKTTKQLAQELNRTETSIHLKAKRMGLKKYCYYCDYDFFETIDNEEKAYWLGFIYADGYITINKKTNSGAVGIELKYSDIEHLRKFNRAINGNYKIDIGKVECSISKYKTDCKMCKLRIYSRKMVDDLMNNNVNLNKSYSEIFPIVKNELMKHFIRGYFDGDGCVRIKKASKHNHEYANCDFTSGTISVLEFIRSYLYENLNINSYISQEKSGVYRLRIYSNYNSLDFLNYIYKDSHVYLDRKYNIYQNIISKHNEN